MTEAYAEKMAWFEFNLFARSVSEGKPEAAYQASVQRFKGHLDNLSGVRKGFWMSEAARIGVTVP